MNSTVSACWHHNLEYSRYRSAIVEEQSSSMYQRRYAGPVQLGARGSAVNGRKRKQRTEYLRSGLQSNIRPSPVSLDDPRSTLLASLISLCLVALPKVLSQCVVSSHTFEV